MKYLKIMVISLLLTLLMIGSVSASDDNATSDNLAVSEDSADVILTTETEGNFSDLNITIANAESSVKLDKDYTYQTNTTDSSSGIVISKPLTIDGQGHSIDGANQAAFFKITSSVTLKNITFKNGKTVTLKSCSGKIENCTFINCTNAVKLDSTTNVNITSSSFISCTSADTGGAIYSTKSNGVTISESTFRQCSCTGEGGAIHIDGTGNIADCNFSSNSAGISGGAVYFTDTGTGTVTNCNFIGNRLNPDRIWGNGGALSLRGKGYVTNCNFTNNVGVGGFGGAIGINKGKVENCNFINNREDSSGEGGAICLSGEGEITKCNFTNNKASWHGTVYIIGKGNVTYCNFNKNSGNAIYFAEKDGAEQYEPYGKVENCNFTNNNGGYGGAVTFVRYGNITNCNFVNNKATSSAGGAIHFSYGCNMANCNFVNNSAVTYGGAVHLRGDFNGVGTITNCNFTDNVANNNGGAVNFESGSTGTVEYCNFNSNSAYDGGAVIGSFTASNSVFTSNKATNDGGAMYGGSASKCNFTNNTALDGGAIHFSSFYSTAENCNFINNSAISSGGAIDAGSYSIVENCNFTDNNAGSAGAVAFKSSGEVTNSKFVNCGDGNKSAVSFGNYYTTLTNSTFVNCTFQKNGQTDISNVTTDNIEYDDIFDNLMDNATVTLTKDYIMNNEIRIEADNIVINGNGFAINAGYSSSFAVKGDNITVKNLILNGVRIIVSGRDTIIFTCSFVNGSALYGGALYFDYNSTGTVRNCNFINNSATYGGAVYAVQNSTAVINNCNFQKNTALLGGAIYGADYSDCNFTQNSEPKVSPLTTVMALIINESEFHVGWEIPITVTLFDSNGDIVNRTLDFYVNNILTRTVTPSVPFSFTPQSEGTYTLKAVFNKSDEYVGSESNLTVTANKTVPHFTVDAPAIGLGEEAYIRVSLANATGYIYIIVEDDEYWGYFSDGVAEFFIYDLPAGNHTINIVYDGNAMFTNASDDTNHITVIKMDSSLSVPDFTFTYGESAFRIISFEGATGVEASINDDKANVNVDGNVVTISNIDGGNYTLTVTTIPDENHNPVTRTADVTVKRRTDANVMVVVPTSAAYGDDTSIVVGRSVEGAFSLTVYSGSDIVYHNAGFISSSDDAGANASNWYADTCSLPVLDAGEYTISVNFLGNRNYLPKTVNETFTVTRQNSKIGLEISQLADECNICVILNDINANPISNQPVIVSFDDVNLTAVTGEDGRALFVHDSTAGEHFVTASYDGNGNYIGNTTSKSIIISTEKTQISINAADTAVGSPTNISAVLKDANGYPLAGHNIQFTLNGNVYNKITDENGSSSLNLYLDAGSYTINASYSGDDKYIASSADKAFTVSKLSSSVKVTSADISYGESASVNVVLSDDAGGTVELTVNSNVYIAEINGGKAGFTLDNLDAGDYNVQASYSGDSKYLPSQNTSHLKVSKADSSLIISDIEFAYGSSGIAEVNLTGCTINPSDISVINHPEALIRYDGKITVSGLDAGTYTLSVTTAPDKNHNAVTKTAKITVSRANPDITVKACDSEYGEAELINITLPADAGGSLKLTLKNMTYSQDVSKGNAVFNISGLEIADYTGTVQYMGDERYLPFNKTISFKVTVRSTKTFAYLSGLISNIPDGGVLELADDYLNDGTYSKNGIAITKSITIDGKGHTIDANNSSRIFSVESSNVTLINIVFKNGYSLNNGGALHITGRGVEVENCTFTDCTANYGGSVYWDGGDGKISSSTFTDSQAERGLAVYSNYDVLIKNCEILGEDSEDAIYGGVIDNCTINGKKLIKTTPSMAVRASDISKDEVQTVKVTLPVDATGRVIFNLFEDDVLVSNSTAQITGGEISFKYPHLSIGVYTLEVIYSGDSEYNQKSSSARFTVSPQVSILQNVTIGDDGRIQINLDDDAGSVIIMIDGRPKSIEEIRNGKIDYVFSTANMTARNHTVTFTYYGEKYSENILKHWNGNQYVPIEYSMYIAPRIIEVPENLKVDDGILELKLPENANGTIIIYIGEDAVAEYDIATKTITNFIKDTKDRPVNITFEMSDEGILTVTHKYLRDDESYTFTLGYSGDEIYEGFSRNMTLHNKISSITADSLEVVYATGAAYPVTVWQDKDDAASGASVIICINGKNFTKLTTDTDGKAAFKVTQAPGTYKVTITALGKTVNATLTVKHLLKLKKVSVKRSAKKLVLTATLGKVNGKYLKKKTVTFKFNGKKYKAKTDKKGVAKVTVKSSALKKLKTGKSVTYQATYKKDTVKKTVKVKK